MRTSISINKIVYEEIEGCISLKRSDDVLYRMSFEYDGIDFLEYTDLFNCENKDDYGLRILDLYRFVEALSYDLYVMISVFDSGSYEIEDSCSKALLSVNGGFYEDIRDDVLNRLSSEIHVMIGICESIEGIEIVIKKEEL